jgi:hypothetical protein
MLRWIVLVLAGLFFGSISLLLLFFRDASVGIKFEVAKALLQLGVVGATGTVVSLLVFEYQRKRQQSDKDADIERKRQEYRETLLLSVLSRALDGYSRAKKARRQMRGTIAMRGKEQVVFRDEYDKCFDVLNTAQIDLETLTRDVETSAQAFSKPVELTKNLRSMETYLRTLIGEYEDWRSRFSGEPASLPLGELQHLANFLMKSDLSKFKPEMVEPRRRVQELIRADLLHPSLPAPN